MNTSVHIFYDLTIYQCRRPVYTVDTAWTVCANPGCPCASDAERRRTGRRRCKISIQWPCELLRITIANILKRCWSSCDCNYLVQIWRDVQRVSLSVWMLQSSRQPCWPHILSRPINVVWSTRAYNWRLYLHVNLKYSIDMTWTLVDYMTTWMWLIR